MNDSSGLILDVVAIRRRAGSRIDFTTRAGVGETCVGDVDVDGGLVDVDLLVETVVGGLTVSGTVRAHWSGPCRRCLIPVEGDVESELHEVFEVEPTEGETWPIVDERIDLTPSVREAVMLSLPLAPLCRESCRGPEPDRFPTGVADEGESSGDPRWAALDEIHFDQ